MGRKFNLSGHFCSTSSQLAGRLFATYTFVLASFTSIHVTNLFSPSVDGH